MTRDVKSGRPDAELARMAAGDAAAFEELHGRHSGFVNSIALHMTGNEAEAEDLTQEAFVAVLGWVGRFRGEASFTTKTTMTIRHTNRRIARGLASFLLTGTVFVTASQTFANANANARQQPAKESYT